MIHLYFYVLLSIIAFVLFLMLYFNVFRKIVIESKKPPFDSLLIAYKLYRGSYDKSGKYIKKTKEEVPGLKVIGIYYDDPHKVPETQLRFIVGAIVGEGENKLADDQMETKLRLQGYQFDSLPAVDYVVTASFPYKSSLSVLVAFLKVYPLFRKYIKEKKLCAHPMLEVYSEDEILFVAPLVRQNDFYLASVRQAAGEDGQRSPEDEETASSFTLPLASSSSASQLSDHSTDSSFEELQLEEAEEDQPS